MRTLTRRRRALFSDLKSRSFMIYHPNLGYLARDYDLKRCLSNLRERNLHLQEIKELIDMARKDGIKTIFVQREYDTKNARAIAEEIGAEIRNY